MKSIKEETERVNNIPKKKEKKTENAKSSPITSNSKKYENTFTE